MSRGEHPREKLPLPVIDIGELLGIRRPPTEQNTDQKQCCAKEEVGGDFSSEPTNGAIRDKALKWKDDEQVEHELRGGGAHNNSKKKMKRKNNHPNPRQRRRYQRWKEREQEQSVEQKRCCAKEEVDGDLTSEPTRGAADKALKRKAEEGVEHELRGEAPNNTKKKKNKRGQRQRRAYQRRMEREQEANQN